MKAIGFTREIAVTFPDTGQVTEELGNRMESRGGPQIDGKEMKTMHDIPDVLEGLRRSPRILHEFVKTIPENKLDVRRGEGFWTIAEHVSHLAQVQPMLFDRFTRFMNEEHPEFVPFIPGKDEGESDMPVCMDIAAALLQFEQYRNKQLILLEKADDNIWQRRADHPEYDRYSLYILTRHVLMHDYWHMYRMEELWLTKDAYLTRLE